MTCSSLKENDLKTCIESTYSKLIEEAYNLKFTDDDLSDVLTYEALQLDQKLKFLRF